MNHKAESLSQATPLQRAVVALKEVRAQFDAHKEAQHEPIAIVGLGCRFPGGANSPEAYWQLLRNGTDAITTVPDARWNAEKFYDANADAPGKISTRHGGFLSHLEQFDPHFFGISPREAISMDPQQRLFLEVAWEALEHAGCAPDRLLNSKTGVFAGVTMSDYLHLAKQQPLDKIDAYFLTGNCLNVVPGRVAFFLGLHGPSLAVDTACSSSLAAIHLAVQSLRANECEMALAGGVNVILMPEILISASRAHMFAADGRCKTFDARADGFVRGEGCGIVVLKRLSAAQKNNDRIFALIRGSALNQDGPSSGLTVPNSDAQKMLLRAALQNARVAAHEVQYVEAHGTGTALGDPIEVRALGEVLREGRAPEHTLMLGSAKTNLGHLESAAGVAGLMKTVLALHHREIPPHLHLQKLNPDISLEEINARIATTLSPWPTWGEKTLAGVSAFGMSGTNVHVILQGASVVSDQLSVTSKQLSVNSHQLPLATDNCSLFTDHCSQVTDHRKERTAHLLTLSAKDETALKHMAERYAEHFAAHADLNLADACYTANLGRAQFRHRLAITAQSPAQAQSRLKDFLVDKEAPGLIKGEAKSSAKKNLAFLYAGQGYQYVGMGRVLFETQPTFRKALQQCDELFRPYLKTSLLEVLYPNMSNTPLASLKGGIAVSNEQRATSNQHQVSSNENQASSNQQPATNNEHPASSIQHPATNLLDQTFYTQPAMFALQYALTQLWLSWGFIPTVVMGHSLGEFMAAQLAGVYSLEDAVKLVAERGRLTEDVPAVGMMASVQAREETVRNALAAYGDNICIAAINGPDSVVITGIKADVNDLLARFEREGVNVRPLAISNAFHSRFIEPALDSFSRIAAEVTYHQPKLPLISTLTGQLLSFDLQTADQNRDLQATIHDPQSTIHNPQTYWRKHLREPVQFYAAMRTLHEMGVDNFLEIGPSPTQLGMGRRCLPEGYGNWFPSLRQGREDWQQMLESLGAMFVSGFDIDLQRFEQDYARRRVTLPTYPFQRKRYWIAESVERGAERKNFASHIHPLLQQCTRSPLLKETIFETRLSTALFPYLDDHKIHGMIVLPLTGHLEIVWAAAKHAFGANASGLEEVVMHEPLLVPEKEERIVQLVFKPEGNDATSFQLISLHANEHKVHVTGVITRNAASATMAHENLNSLQARCAQEIPREDFYHNLHERGLQFGPQFQSIQKLWRGNNEALGKIVLAEGLLDASATYNAHPALLDACLQVFAAAWPRESVAQIIPPLRGARGVLLASSHNAEESKSNALQCVASDHENLTAQDDTSLKGGNANSSATFLPLRVESYRFYQRASATLWSHVTMRAPVHSNGETYLGEVAIYNEDGALVAELKGFLLKRTSAEALQNVLHSDVADWFYETMWRKQPLPAASAARTPLQIAAAAKGQLPALRAEKDLAAYEALLPQLDQLCAAYVAQALRQLGCSLNRGERFTTLALALRLGVRQRHHRLFERMLSMLAEENILQRESEEWIVCRAPETANLEALAATLLQKYPASATELQLTITCGTALANVLCGEQDPLHLLFPNGSVEFLERLYQHSPLTQAMNRLAAQAIAEALAHFPRERKLRVLEIGAGTGGTTAFVLPQLQNMDAEYVFTDVSPLFLAKAKEKFREFDFVHYQTLDIERSPLAQNFSAHQFDIVIATNALHATADLRQALRHARELLREDGLALFIEGTSPERWVDLTFGLTEGWWRFTDTDLRSTSPLISKQEWLGALADTGFNAACTLPATEDEAQCGRALGQHAMILARAVTHARVKSSWLIFADESGMSEHLQTLLHAQSQHTVLVRAGAAYERRDENHFTLNAQRPEDLQQLLRDALPEGECSGVIYLWAKDQSTHDALSLEELERTQIKSGAAVLHLTQALIKANLPSTPRLWLITRNAQAVLPQDESVEAVQASLWGLGKVISLEHPELHCTRIDVAANNAAAAQNLFDEIRSHEREDMIAYRGRERYVARLARCAKGESKVVDRGSWMVADETQKHRNQQPATSNQQLTITSPGVLDRLQYQPITRRVPQAGEIEIRVHNVGLNFRDVLNALGMYPGDAGALGADCSGVIVAVGEGVSEFRLGDEVLALAPGCFGTFVTTAAELAAFKPESLSFAEASAIPSAFLTAHEALIALAKIQTDERVLIHSAAGGVGLAAVQLAKHAGAEIFATAGNEEKRALLRKLGVAHVFDSRSLAFEEQIMALTNNAGVDVVLNSLSGDYIRASLAVLKEHGRFLEIGKRGIWPRTKVEAFKKVSAYHVIDLAAEAHENPATIKTMLHEIMRGFAEGSLQPLPQRVYPASEVVSAFRLMQSAKHIGKIVVEQIDEDRGSWRADRRSSSSIHNPQSTIHDPQSTILITGGLAGLGLLTAQWLVEQGARHLALMARSAPSENTLAAIAEMEKRGAKIFVAQGDVSREEDVKSVLFEIRKSLPRLRGVIHSAGVLDDGAVLQQNWSRFETVLAPKVRGAWLLHQLTQDEPLDLFVLYSSMTSMLGTAGQANHAMANAFLDGLAHYRRSRGQAGMSIHWGAWSEIGAAAARKVETRASVQGLGSIAPQKGLQALDRILRQNPIEVGVAPINWARYAQQFAGARAPFFAELITSAQTKVEVKKESASKPQPKILAQLQNAPSHLRKNLLLAYVKEQALRVLGLEASHPLDQEQPLQKMGLDSLMSVELRNVLGAGLALQRALPATLLFDYPTVTAVADYLAKDVLAGISGKSDLHAKTIDGNKNLFVQVRLRPTKKEELAQLSEEEAEALLLEELNEK